MSSKFIFMLLFSCATETKVAEPSDEGTITQDADGDGFDSEQYNGLDCNDRNPSINPLADEIEADGIDQNCSGSDLKAPRLGCATAGSPVGFWFLFLLAAIRRERRL